MPVLTKDTIEILKNFHEINPSLFFEEGNILRTIDFDSTIMSRAEIDIDIPFDFAILDLKAILQVLPHFKEPYIEFQQEGLKIFNNDEDTPKKKKSLSKKDFTSIAFTNSDFVTKLENDRAAMPSVDVQFTLFSEDILRMRKVAHSLKLDTIEILGRKGEIIIKARSSKKGSIHTFERRVGETNSTFQCILLERNLKILPRQYQVDVSFEGLIHFKSDKLEYWTGVEDGSNIN